MRLPPGLGMLLAIAALPDREPVTDGHRPECGERGYVNVRARGRVGGWTRRPCPRGCPQIADEPEAGR